MSTAVSAAAAVTALQGALAAENAAIYGYGIVGSMLSGGEQAAATTDWKLHQEARDTLDAIISKLGATPAPANAVYGLPFPVTNANAARQLAAALEEMEAEQQQQEAAQSQQKKAGR